MRKNKFQKNKDQKGAFHGRHSEPSKNQWGAKNPVGTKGDPSHSLRMTDTGPSRSFRVAPQGPSPQIGELSIAKDGYGFVILKEASDSDVFVPAQYIGGAMHKDIVEVRVVRGFRGKMEGRISRVIKRNTRNVVGRIERHGDRFQVVTDDGRVHHRMFVSMKKSGGARHGDNVVVRILRYPDSDKTMEGEVLEILGKRTTLETESKIIIARHHLEREFPPPVEREAATLHSLVTKDAISSRVNLRDLPFVTIDGETAKDFDDAVFAKRTGGGVIKLFVAIADVAHFVREGSAIDRLAYDRGTSVYFPGTCLPMLPEALSNDLCSLRADEDKFTLTAEMDIDLSGEVIARKFYRSVIKSARRMTYTEVKKIIVEKDEAIIKQCTKIMPLLEVMKECFDRLLSKRKSRGSIDFDLPEPLIVIDMQGGVEGIVRADRHIGHMMIEEFMIAANVCVAEFLESHGANCMYRVHESPPPDKLKDFCVLMHNLGHKTSLSADSKPGAFSKVVELVKGLPYERLVNHMLLRSMSQAVYSPLNKGHFGLSLESYCHFTSPIRRYPDLIVHRELVRLINLEKSMGKKVSHKEGKGKKAQPSKASEEVAWHLSRCERAAMEAEREMAKLYCAMFMQEHVGEKFKGVISHVAKFGFFVELETYFVEGLVHVDSIGGDQFKYDENGFAIRGTKKKKMYKIGDELEITVSEVDIANRTVNFAV